MIEAIYRLPHAFLQKLEKLYPSYHQQILNTFLTKKETTFRINFLKINLVSLRKRLLEERIYFQELSFPPGAFISRSSLKDLQGTRLYQEGCIYVQNVSSMLPVCVLGPEKGDKILDLCAAPGAKTTQIVSLAPESEVVAFEKDHIRHCKLVSNLKIQGVDAKVKTFQLDGFWARKKFPEYFDKVLVDVPCSAEGLFDLHNPRSYKYWNERKVREVKHKQRFLLQSAFFTLKEQGTLVYSTCTFSPEENEEVIDWFINKFKDKVEVVPVEIPLKGVFQGLTQWQGRPFSPSCKLTRRVIPNEFMEAFFVAKLRKISA